MKYIVMVLPNPESELRLQGEDDSLLGALEALIATVDEYGSDQLTVSLSLNFEVLRENALSWPPLQSKDL